MPNGVGLARVGQTLTIDMQMPVSPHEIVYMASGGNALALLLRTPEKTWAVAVMEENGLERWRAEVPATFASQLDGGFVAMSDRRVVLLAGDALLAWDATSGKPVGGA